MAMNSPRHGRSRLTIIVLVLFSITVLTLDFRDVGFIQDARHAVGSALRRSRARPTSWPRRSRTRGTASPTTATSPPRTRRSGPASTSSRATSPRTPMPSVQLEQLLDQVDIPWVGSISTATARVDPAAGHLVLPRRRHRQGLVGGHQGRHARGHRRRPRRPGRRRRRRPVVGPAGHRPRVPGGRPPRQQSAIRHGQGAGRVARPAHRHRHRDRGGRRRHPQARDHHHVGHRRPLVVPGVHPGRQGHPHRRGQRRPHRRGVRRTAGRPRRAQLRERPAHDARCS